MSNNQFDPPVINIKSDELRKGEIRNGKQLIAWDCIQDCNDSECPIRHSCLYKPKSPDIKCNVQVQYLEALTNMVLSTYRYLSDDAIYKVGMHIIPLYSMLCRQKIVEKSVINLAYEDAKGVTRIHPIYKEIRETMKVIAMMWKELGINGTPDPDLPNTGRAGFGDNQHYNSIAQETHDKRGLVR